MLLDVGSAWLDAMSSSRLLYNTVPATLSTSLLLFALVAALHVVLRAALRRRLDTRCLTIPLICATLATMFWNIFAPSTCE